jgi:hypothetical protein
MFTDVPLLRREDVEGLLRASGAPTAARSGGAWVTTRPWETLIAAFRVAAAQPSSKQGRVI